VSDRLKKEEYDALVADLLVQGPGFICKATAAAHRLARKTVRRAWFSGWPSRGWKSAKELYEERKEQAKPPAVPQAPTLSQSDREKLGTDWLVSTALRQLSLAQEVHHVGKRLATKLRTLSEAEIAALKPAEATALVNAISRHAYRTGQLVQVAVAAERLRAGKVPELDVTFHVDRDFDPVDAARDAELLAEVLEHAKAQPSVPALPPVTNGGPSN